MTIEETGVVMDILQAAYPRYYSGPSAPNPEQAVSLWSTMFADDDLQLVLAAVKAFIATDIKGFPPHIGAIKSKLRQLTAPKETTELEAWGMVYRAICNSAYNSENEFSKLPKLIQGIVGDPGQLREWAMMPSDTVQSVVASNFQRSYRARAQHEREFAALPGDVQDVARMLASGMSMPKLEGGADE